VARRIFREQALQAYLDPDQRGTVVRVARPSMLAFAAVLLGLFGLTAWIVVTVRVPVAIRGRGTIRPRGEVFFVRAPVSAQVRRVAVAAGQAVTVDAVLLEFDDAALRAEVVIARDNLKQQQQLLQEMELPRQAPAEAARARLLQRAKQLQRLSRARAIHEGLRAKLARLTVRAPLRGILDRINAQQGGYIKEGEPLAKIVPAGGDLVGMMRVEARHRSRLAVGQTVRIKLDEYPSDGYGVGRGRIERISRDITATDDERPTVAVDVKLVAFPGGVHDGSFRSGMGFVGEIALRRRRIASMLFPPLERLLDR